VGLKSCRGEDLVLSKDDISLKEVILLKDDLGG
jgi:hypothetical protein